MKAITALLSSGLTLLSLMMATQSDSPDEVYANTIVDFENDLIPVFTKSGCNAGGCHGAAIGRGRLQLSLFGGNPRKDYQNIVHELG